MESINSNRKYALCDVAAAPVRKEATHRSELVNQLVYGELLEVLDAKEEWRYIKSLYDGYEGWVTFHLIKIFEEGKLPIMEKPVFATELFTEKSLDNGENLYLPMGSFIWKREEDGEKQNDKRPLVKNIIQTAKKWLHVPYLWGGKTGMGVDCSGFVQTVFKVHGIVLQRDAFQQAVQGVPINLPEAKAGDVAFFNNESGRITHVGILINGQQIIHAAGKVRIDTIDENGIQNEELKTQTHTLHSVRRMIPNETIL